MHSRPFSFLQDLARQEGVSLRVQGDCMDPQLPSGSMVTVRPRRFYLPGDVVVFRTRAGDLAAHRVLGYRPKAGRMLIVTKGDHCTQHDAPVDRRQIVGSIDGVGIAIPGRVRALLRFAGIVWKRLIR